MTDNLTRRRVLQSLATLFGGTMAYQSVCRARAQAGKKVREWQQSIKKGLNWIQKTQSSLGHWTAGNYPTAMTALGRNRPDLLRVDNHPGSLCKSNPSNRQLPYFQVSCQWTHR